MAELERRGVPRRWFERERYRIPKPSSGGVNFESRRARLSAANNATAPTPAPSSAAPPLAVIWLHGLALCSSSCATDACGACNCALPELGEYDGGFSAGSRLKLPGGAVLSSPHANPDPISVGWLDGVLQSSRPMLETGPSDVTSFPARMLSINAGAASGSTTTIVTASRQASRT